MLRPLLWLSKKDHCGSIAPMAHTRQSRCNDNLKAPQMAELLFEWIVDAVADMFGLCMRSASQNADEVQVKQLLASAFRIIIRGFPRQKDAGLCAGKRARRRLLCR